ncbi:MAG: hypothetical protein ACE366_00390 [Bradymonadia bacterium]
MTDAPQQTAPTPDFSVHDFARGTLKTWGVISIVHGLVMVLATWFGIPWKSPMINTLLIVLGLGGIVAGVLQWRGGRLGWRAGQVVASIWLVLGTLIIGGLLMSWAYLKGIYGDFGRGGAIASMLVALVAFLVIALVPTLHLRALLRKEMRLAFGAGDKIKAAALIIALLPLPVAWWAHSQHHLAPEVPALSAAGQLQAVQLLKARMQGADLPPTPDLDGAPMGPGPVYVSLWGRGELAARVGAESTDLKSALLAAADTLKDHPVLTGKRLARHTLKIDRVVAKGPVLSSAGPILALSVNPGLDGLRRAPGADELPVQLDPFVALPDDMIQADVFGAAPLVPGIRELRLGLDVDQVLPRLANDGAPIERLRLESWVSAGQKVLPVVRGNTPGPEPGPVAWRNAAIRGGDFVRRQIRKDNRFHYQYLPYTDHHPGGANYSIPRHAGTVYSLALLFGETGHKRFKQSAERAILWLGEQTHEGCLNDGDRCVVKGGVAMLGSTALTLVGMLEYQRRTGDTRYAEQARSLLKYVMALQQPNGEFQHKVIVGKRQIDPSYKGMFYSEEAALALVMAHKILGDDTYLAAAERALNYLTGPKYDFFLGRFVYGADHWTCIAAEEAWPTLKHDQYFDFCKGYADFIALMQYPQEGWQNADFRGHYGFGALLVPQAPAAAGFTEAIVSTYRLSRHRGAPDPELKAQMSHALDALVRDQLRFDNAWLVKRPLSAVGGFRRSLVESEVRIDFTQHALSALIRGAVVLEEETRPES